MSERRVRYFEPDDWSFGSNYRRAEEILKNWNNDTNITDINDIIEFHNIHRYFNSGIRHGSWDESTYSQYMDKCKKIPSLLGRFFGTLSDATIEAVYSNVIRDYRDDFWNLVATHKAHKRIGADAIKRVLDTHTSALAYILHHKALVTHYGEVIAESLKQHPHTAEWLISYYLVAHDRLSKTKYFPKELTPEVQDQLLHKYVDSPQPNSNYLQVLGHAQSTKEFPVSDKLKLKAIEKWEASQQNHSDTGVQMYFGVEIGFKSIPDGSVEHSEKDHIYSSKYSREWIDDNQDFATLLNNFIYLFEYVDRFFRCSFTSLKADLGVLERNLGLKGIKDYETGIGFQFRKMQTTAQLQAYLGELKRLNIRLEDIFKWFFEENIKTEFNAVGFSYAPPSEGTTYAEKCKLLGSAIDGILKQYRLFEEDGYVNRKLLEISSGHIIFGDLPSLREKKYAYVASQDTQKEMFLLFSDQSMMSYTDKTEDKYDTLPQLLLNEQMTKADFQDYHMADLQWLIDRGSVICNESGHLTVSKIRVFLLKDLFKNEVLCPSYFDDALRQEVDQLVSSGDLEYGNTLFSRPEQEYLNYMLNKAEFSNGQDLRNKYLHDTHPQDEKTQYQDYLELLKIMILIIIKINEELCMKNDSE